MNSNEILCVQELIGCVLGIKSSMDKSKNVIDFYSESMKKLNISNSPSLRDYDLRFNELVTKYAGFAGEYESLLNNFDKSLNDKLSNFKNIEQERLEVISNLSDHDNISFNPRDLNDDYSTAAVSPCSSGTEKENEEEKEKEDKTIKTEKKKKIVRKIAVSNKTKKVQKIMNEKKKNEKKKKKKKMIKKEVELKNESKTEEKENENENEYGYQYKYDASKVDWMFNGVCRSSTVVFISNLPSNSTVQAVQSLFTKKMKIKVGHIEQVNIKSNQNGRKYATVRIASCIKIQRITNFINNINKENQSLFEKHSKKEMDSFSWKKKISLKFNNTMKYYTDENEMYSDPHIYNTLYIRNFDILNRNCHKELTELLMFYGGDLVRHIKIGTDKYFDPYCLVTFNEINGAIFCCNSNIQFNGRSLEMKYASY